MPRPSRFGRVAKWCGVGVCAVLLAAWGVSPWRMLLYETPLGGRSWSLGFQAHSTIFTTFPDEYWVGSYGWYWHEQRPSNRLGYLDVHFGPDSRLDISLPLYIPFLLIAIPTVWLFWRESKRRSPPGRCKNCGYNLRGLIMPRCPECATSFDLSTVSEE